MKCSCGQELSQDMKFCKNCGKRVERICSNCSVKLDAEDKFCFNCGEKVGNNSTIEKPYEETSFSKDDDTVYVENNDVVKTQKYDEYYFDELKYPSAEKFVVNNEIEINAETLCRKEGSTSAFNLRGSWANTYNGKIFYFGHILKPEKLTYSEEVKYTFDKFEDAILVVDNDVNKPRLFYRLPKCVTSMESLQVNDYGVFLVTYNYNTQEYSIVHITFDGEVVNLIESKKYVSFFVYDKYIYYTETKGKTVTLSKYDIQLRSKEEIFKGTTKDTNDDSAEITANANLLHIKYMDKSLLLDTNGNIIWDLSKVKYEVKYVDLRYNSLYFLNNNKIYKTPLIDFEKRQFISSIEENRIQIVWEHNPWNTKHSSYLESYGYIEEKFVLTYFWGHNSKNEHLGNRGYNMYFCTKENYKGNDDDLEYVPIGNNLKQIIVSDLLVFWMDNPYGIFKMEVFNLRNAKRFELKHIYFKELEEYYS